MFSARKMKTEHLIRVSFGSALPSRRGKGEGYLSRDQPQGRRTSCLAALHGFGSRLSPLLELTAFLAATGIVTNSSADSQVRPRRTGGPN